MSSTKVFAFSISLFLQKFDVLESEYDQLPEGIIDYDKIIKMLRIRLLALPKDGFTNKDQMLTEKQW